MSNPIKNLTDAEARKAFPLAKKYANASKLSRVEWLKTRRSGIGGSEVAAILGLSKWSSEYQIWLDKTSNEEPEEKKSNVLEWGSRLEPVIRQKVADETDGQVYIVPQMLRSKKYPHMCADLDGVILTASGEWVGLEIKTHREYGSKDWAFGVPAYYQTQVQHYMAVTGLKKFIVVCLLNGSDFVSYEVEANTDFISALYDVEQKFWNKVQSGEKPLADGSDGTAKQIAKLYGDARTADKVVLEGEQETVMVALLDSYQSAKDSESDAKEAKTLAANRIKEMLGVAGAKTVAAGDYVVSWTMNETTSFDADAFKKDYPELFERYTSKKQRDGGIKIKTA